MKNNKFFTHRFLPILSIFLFIAFVFTTNVFAVTKDDLIDVSNLDLSKYPSGYSLDNGYVMVVNNGAYDIFIMPNNFNGSLLLEGSRLYTSNGSNYLVIRMYQDRFDDYFIANTCTNNTEIFYGTMNVYNSSGNVVFQQPPQEKKVLVEVMEKEQAEKKTIKEILGIIPLTLVVVVSFLGLRKALQMLLSFLRRS